MTQAQLDYNNFLYDLENGELLDECIFRLMEDNELKVDMAIDTLCERLEECCFFGKRVKSHHKSNEDLLRDYWDYRIDRYYGGNFYNIETEFTQRLKECGFFGNRYVIIEKVINK